MFFMRKERKKCHPCVKLALIGLGVIGAVAVVDKGKCFVMNKMSNITRFFKCHTKSMMQCADQSDNQKIC